MKSKLHNLAAASAFALMAGTSGAAHALLFMDVNGSDAGMNHTRVDTFDWGPINLLFDGLDALSPVGDTNFTLMGHGNLSAFLTSTPSTTALPAGQEWTFRFALPMSLTVGGLAGTQLNSLGGGYFEVFYDNTADYNALLGAGAGGGLADGTLVMAGTFNSGTSIGSMGGPLANALQDLDQHDSDGGGPVPMDNWNNTQTEKYSGNLTLSIDLTTFNPLFFNEGIIEHMLGLDLNLESGGPTTPFINTDPSYRFFNLAKTAIEADLGEANCTVSGGFNGAAQGCINDLLDGNGGMLLATGDANSGHNLNSIPEPGTLALFGAALAGMGVSARRQRKSKNA